MITTIGYKLNFKLPEPFSISFHTFYYRESVVVYLKYKTFVGMGEANPFQPITGDTQQDVIDQLKLVQEIPLNPEKDSVKKLHKYLDKTISSQTLRAALDFAYHDLIGKIKGVPVYQLYAKKARTLDNSITVFIKDTPAETAADAKKALKEFPEMKILKIKLKGTGDIPRVRAIKKVMPKNLRYTVDANQGFKDPKKAVKDLTEIGNILENVILVEEPCPKGELDKLKYVTDHMTNMLVFADESATTVDDARAVVKAKAAHGINIKLQKAGGIVPGREIAKLATDAGMKLMVGCMLEGPLGIAAGVHFADSTKGMIMADLDGDLYMVNHTKGEAAYKNGQRIPSEIPGLGVTYKMSVLKKLIQEGEVVYEKI